MKTFFTAFFLLVAVFLENAGANRYPGFTFHKLDSGRPGNTLLVIAGIQGDEPGGFNAASLLVTRYMINKGSVWIVPNLNFISIINRTRGVYGDLNRKFKTLPGNDPEFNTIQKIKTIILEEEVDLVLNHHDGSGFYRPTHVDNIHNPNRWGQSIIIDQERINTEPFGNLGELAVRVKSYVNKHLYNNEHRYHIKNTHTRLGNTEMAKTLTYFAIRNSKPAFGVEASKSFPTHLRAYYHLRILESFMNILGIEYERDFVLSGKEVANAINTNIKLALYNKRILLDVANARNRLDYIPLKKSSDIEFTPSNPLIAIINSGKSYRVFHGNRRMTRIHPEYFEYDWSIDRITMQIDDYTRSVNFGEMVEVEKGFRIEPMDGYRINVIGFKKQDVFNESGVLIDRNNIQEKFSLDKKGKIYRIEVYRNSKFTGMVLVNFRQATKGLRASAARKNSGLKQPN
jgi:hypothetical protein